MATPFTPPVPIPRANLQIAQELLRTILLKHVSHPFLLDTRRELFSSLVGYSGEELQPIVGVGIAEWDEGQPVLEFLTTVPEHELAIPRMLYTLGLRTFPFHVWQTGQSFAAGRPAHGGDSIGHFHGDTGTLGCVVRDRFEQNLILSCSHVLAQCGAASLGDAIWQPGSQDGGGATDKIGTLHAFEDVHMGGTTGNVFDAALCLPESPSDVTSSIRSIGNLSGYDPAPPFGIDVQKHGWKTGHTTGVLRIKRLSLLVPFSGGNQALFDDQLGIIGKTQARFADPGDSGAIVADAQHKALGLVISTFNAVNLTIACRVEPVLLHFSVALQ